MNFKQFDVAQKAFRSGNYAKAKFIFDYALKPLVSQPSCKNDSLAWIEYANTCQMLGYYKEAERAYKLCDDFGFYQEFIHNELKKMSVRKLTKKIPDVICNHEKLSNILSSIVSCFPRITKDIIAFVGKDQSAIDDFFINNAGFSKTYRLNDYSELACGFYDNPQKYVLVFSEKFFSVFKTDSEIIGDCAHELAHFALASGMTIQEICYYFDTEIKNELNTAISDSKYMSGNGNNIANNEYVADATAISCGFAYDLSAAWRAKQCYYENGLSDKLIAPEIIDTFWHRV